MSEARPLATPTLPKNQGPGSEWTPADLRRSFRRSTGVPRDDGGVGLSGWRQGRSSLFSGRFFYDLRTRRRSGPGSPPGLRGVKSA